MTPPATTHATIVQDDQGSFQQRSKHGEERWEPHRHWQDLAVPL